MEENSEKEIDEQTRAKIDRIRQVATSYYARKDVQQAIFDFCKNRETIPRYFEGFGKRPDMLDYPADIFSYVKKGATSFHCSEELWENPLEIATGMVQDEANRKRIGWDFLIDIDSKYLDYSKIAAELMIKALEYHGVNGVGVKFSGSKGMHIIIPWRAFPKEFNGEKTCEKFPEWPRIIASYLQEMVRDKLNEKIIELTGKQKLEEAGELISKYLCPKCHQELIEGVVSKYKCNNSKCKSEMTSMKSNRKTLRCPSCSADMSKISEEKIFRCAKCKINSIKITESISTYGGEARKIEKQIQENITTKSQEDSVDVVLVSSRHLFRAPYSLHEKTRLASIVIDKEKIKDFNPLFADPMKVEIKNYLPECEEGEASELLAQALDWQNKKVKKIEREYSGEAINVKNLEIKEEFFPECIKKILSGIKQDGRKRALFILLAFLRSLEISRDKIEEKLEEWNKKNYKPLQEGYIKSQLDWFEKNKILPPNCGSHYYKELNISCNCNVKNPLSFAIKKALQAQGYKRKNGER
jgi:ribosomal protein L37AE/L43A